MEHPAEGSDITTVFSERSIFLLPAPSEMRFLIIIYVWLLAAVSAANVRYNSRAFDSLLSKRQSNLSQSPSTLLVDLGYDQYMGVANVSTGLNTWKG